MSLVRHLYVERESCPSRSHERTRADQHRPLPGSMTSLLESGTLQAWPLLEVCGTQVLGPWAGSLVHSAWWVPVTVKHLLQAPFPLWGI